MPVNAFLMKGPEPVLVDTGLSALRAPMLERLFQEIDPEDLRWIWLSHTDADHIGNLDRILELAPNATVVTSFLGAGKMGLMGVGDPDRFRLLEPGEVFEAGGRRLHQVKPPYYDAPETMGFFDETDRVLFAADAFGALVQGRADEIDEIPAPALREGMIAWSSVDAPWLANIDRPSLAGILGMLESLGPEVMLSGHLPVAHRLETLTGIIRGAYGLGITDIVRPEAAAEIEAAFS
ncbi:MBL fold metallo-hydrolase [Nisaea sediminum]|uniref:MBL fold metallo-hydrolase n=1 Tax=Nisaea sediminum TaxID=2775867 RepID=UPI0021F80A8C|nr:MBL fold metallo-hydrolase [Nisaea sediminum]